MPQESMWKNGLRGSLLLQKFRCSKGGTTVRIKFKHQSFQIDAVNSVVDAFEGQPNEASRYTLDLCYGLRNNPIKLLDYEVLDNIRGIQRRNGLKLSQRLEGRFNLTIEMETGTGKTYTYIR